MKPIKRKKKTNDSNTFKPIKHKKNEPNNFKPVKHTRYKLPKKNKKEAIIEKLVEDDVKVGEYGFIHIYFKRSMQHFYLRYVNKDGTQSERRNMYACSFIKALSNALNTATAGGLITNGIAPSPPEEEDN